MIVCSPEDVDEVATDVSIVDSSYAIGLILYMLDNRYRDFFLEIVGLVADVHLIGFNFKLDIEIIFLRSGGFE